MIVERVKPCIQWFILQFLAYGSQESLFPISMSPTTDLWVQNTFLMTSLQYYCIIGLAEIKTLHPRDKIMHKRCTMRKLQNHCCIVIIFAFSLTLLCDLTYFFHSSILTVTDIYMTLLEQVWHSLPSELMSCWFSITFYQYQNRMKLYCSAVSSILLND